MKVIICDICGAKKIIRSITFNEGWERIDLELSSGGRHSWGAELDVCPKCSEKIKERDPIDILTAALQTPEIEVTVKPRGQQ